LNGLKDEDNFTAYNNDDYHLICIKYSKSTSTFQLIIDDKIELYLDQFSKGKIRPDAVLRIGEATVFPDEQG